MFFYLQLILQIFTLTEVNKKKKGIKTTMLLPPSFSLLTSLNLFKNELLYKRIIFQIIFASDRNTDHR